MLSNAAAPERAGDRAEMSTTECIEFLQSGELAENKSVRETGLKKYLIRHSVWLRERMERSLVEGGRKEGQDVFQGKLSKESVYVCVRRPCVVCCVYIICLFVLQKGVTVCTSIWQLLDIK